MKVAHYTQIESAPVDMEGSVGCQIRCLIGQADGAPHFTMRQFDVAPGGHTPKHTHPFEHEVYILEGQGVVLEGNTEHPLSPGTAVYVPSGQLHQFRNTGAGTLKFLCLIPHPLGDMSGPCTAACACD
ncbi:MAG: cupin domain-containing protein [Pirellulales bacterium]|nr:cupin domain-containing protein [Pirellulales bacterium]